VDLLLGILISVVANGSSQRSWIVPRLWFFPQISRCESEQMQTDEVTALKSITAEYGLSLRLNGAV
jgi:hypothetical protein